jgi:hypothetical protein
MHVLKRVLAAAIVIVLTAGCGSGGSKHPSVVAQRPPAATTTTKTPTPEVRVLIRDYKELGVDISTMRAAAAKVHGQTLKGTPALRRSTGAFIEDLEKSHLTLKSKNRMIDHAAGAVATSCDQCFQQLEAVRPIPQIAHPH